MKATSLAAQINSLLVAITNCEASGNTEWKTTHSLNLRALCREYLPSGSGIDNGTILDEGATKPGRLVFSVGFHHMNGESGMYERWTYHLVIVTPEFDGVNVRVTGQNYNGIKDYLAEVYSQALSAIVEVSKRWTRGEA